MIVTKALDTNRNVYFALSVLPGSFEMHQIKSCPVRYWDIKHRVWLIPYSINNWRLLVNKIGNIPYSVKTDKLILDYIPGKTHNKIIKEKDIVLSKTHTELSDNHKFALLKMKEQLVIRRYQMNTQKTYIISVTEFLNYYNGRTADSLLYEDIRNYLLHKIHNDKISESTQNSIINAIKFYYEKVEKREKFYLYDLRPRKSSMLPGFLSKEDTAKLLSVTENIKHRLILQLIYSAGLRLGELTRLKVRDIHRDMGIIEIKCAKGKKDRIVSLARTIIPLLQQYLSIYNPRYYLFEGQTGGKYSDRSVQNIMHQAVQKSGVDENATVHTLRHTYATHLILDGMDIRRVQELLGHNSIKTTAIYTHITDPMKKNIISPLDNLDLTK